MTMSTYMQSVVLSFLKDAQLHYFSLTHASVGVLGTKLN